MKKIYMIVLCFFSFTYLHSLQVIGQDGITVAGGHGDGSAANQIVPRDVFVDKSGNVYIADLGNNRIQKWAPGATEGVTVAGGNDRGDAANQLFAPYGVHVDPAGNVLIADYANNRIQLWAPGAKEGITVGGGHGAGNRPEQFAGPRSVYVDAAGYIYVLDYYNLRVQRWTPGATEGITVVSSNGAGSGPDQINFSEDAFVDLNGNIYVADFYNNRIQKFAPDSKNATTVAGGNGPGSAPNQLHSPTGVFVDAIGNVFVADAANNRIQKWAPGVSEGVTVAGGSFGSAANQLASPSAVFVDDAGNIYVADQGNDRIQKFGTEGLTYKYYEGSWNALPDFSTLTPIKTGRSGISDLSVRTPGRDDNFAFVWEGYIKITTPGMYTFETVSDDGSRVYFNSWYNPSAIPTVNNDGIHAPLSATGTVNVTSAGIYPIAFTFFEKDGGQQMQVYWSGPGIERQLIPNSVFTQMQPPPTKGLNYKYYEGTWNSLPDFNTLTPVKTGNSANVDITARTPGRNDNFAFVWEGYINITNPGSYTFETISDDGSKVYFNSDYNPIALATVNNDGIHAPVSATGTVTIPSAGMYPISFTFFEKDGGEQMQVYWSGPGIERQLIPDSAFTHIQPPSAGGLNYKYYEGDFSTLPDFSMLTPVKTGKSPNLNLDVRTSGVNDHFAFMWEGYINLPAAGNYTFETISDDGSKVYFNTPYAVNANSLVNNDGVHAPLSASGTISVPSAGQYPISITFFEKDGGETMQLYYTGPGIERQLVPDAAFMPTNFTNNTTVMSGVPIAGNLVGTTETAASPKIYPNPFRENFTFDYYHSGSTKNKVSIGIYDLNGRLMFTYQPGTLVTGYNRWVIHPGSRKLAAGVYLAQLNINGIPATTIKLVKAKR